MSTPVTHASEPEAQVQELLALLCPHGLPSSLSAMCECDRLRAELAHARRSAAA